MKKYLLSLLIAYSFTAMAQQPDLPVLPGTLNIGGGSVLINPGFVVDFSIGESTVIETWYGENAFANTIMGIHWNLTSGVLQPFDKKHVIFNYLVPDFTNQEVRFYPVPTPGEVFIDFRSALRGKVTIQLYSGDGKLHGTKEFMHTGTATTHSWDLSNRTSGIYLFRILLTSDSGDQLKQGTFKVEKNK